MPLPDGVGPAIAGAAICILMQKGPARYTVPVYMFMPVVMCCMLASMIHEAEDMEPKLQKAVRFAYFFTPIFVSLVLYHFATRFTRLPILPFTPPTGNKSWEEIVHEAQATGQLPPATTKTLRRRPLAAASWFALSASAAAYLYVGGEQYYKYAWATAPLGLVIAMMTYAGAELGPGRVVLLPAAHIGWQLHRLAAEHHWITPDVQPLEEAVYNLLASYAVLQALSLLDHLNVLFLLDPTLPAVPPNSFERRFGLFCNIYVFKPREIDMRMLSSIVYLDETLRDEARISHLHSPRNFSIPYLVINSWYLCVMRLVRDDTGADVYVTRRRTIAAIKLFLVQAYDEQTPALERVFTLCTIPHATPKDHAVFYLFATLIPRLVPIYPFLELCEGGAVDAAFMPESNVALAVRISEPDFDLDAHLPIHTRDQLKAYTTAVYGSFVSAFVYLSWSVLEECQTPKKPADSLAWAEHAHKTNEAESAASALQGPRQALIQRARALGHAFGLITIAVNVMDDARERRLYLPLSSFASTSELLAVMSGLPPPEHLVVPLLDASDKIRTESPVFREIPRAVRRDLREIFSKAASAANRVRAGYRK